MQPEDHLGSVKLGRRSDEYLSFIENLWLSSVFEKAKSRAE